MLRVQLEILPVDEGPLSPKADSRWKYRLRLDAQGMPGGESMWDARYEDTAEKALLAAHAVLTELLRRIGVQPGDRRATDKPEGGGA